MNQCRIFDLGGATNKAIIHDGFFKSVMPYYKKRGLMDETPFRFDLERERLKAGPLKFSEPNNCRSSSSERKIAFAASVDAGRTARVIASLEAPADHPVSIDHLEGRYLTGLLLRA